MSAHKATILGTVVLLFGAGLLVLRFLERNAAIGHRSANREETIEPEGRESRGSTPNPANVGPGSSSAEFVPGDRASWRLSGTLCAAAGLDPVTAVHCRVLDAGRFLTVATSVGRGIDRTRMRFTADGTAAGRAFLFVETGGGESVLGSASGYPMAAGDALDLGDLYWGPFAVWIRIVTEDGTPAETGRVQLRDLHTPLRRNESLDEQGEVHVLGWPSEALDVTIECGEEFERDGYPRLTLVSAPREPTIVPLRRKAEISIRAVIGNRPVGPGQTFSVLFRGLDEKLGVSGLLTAEGGAFRLLPGLYDLEVFLAAFPDTARATQRGFRVTGENQQLHVSFDPPSNLCLLTLAPESAGMDDDVDGWSLARYQCAPGDRMREATSTILAHARGAEVSLLVPRGIGAADFAWVEGLSVHLNSSPARIEVAGTESAAYASLRLQRAGAICLSVEKLKLPAGRDSRVSEPGDLETSSTAPGAEASDPAPAPTGSPEVVAIAVELIGDDGEAKTVLYTPRVGARAIDARGSEFVRVARVSCPGECTLWAPPGAYRLRISRGGSEKSMDCSVRAGSVARVTWEG